MGRLGKLTILLTLGVWGVTTEGSPPDGVAATSTRPALSAPAGEYLKGGISLYNTGDPALAGKYLKVANDYRDQLQPASRPSSTTTRPSSAPAPTDAAVRPPRPRRRPDARRPQPAFPHAGSDQPRHHRPKQEARWKLQSAKEQMRLGNYDEADKLVAQVRQMPVKWGLFDETPDKVGEAIAKARPKLAARRQHRAGPHDKATAVAKLKEARACWNPTSSSRPRPSPSTSSRGDLPMVAGKTSRARWPRPPGSCGTATRPGRCR